MASAILSCSADKNLVPERTGDDRTVDLRAWRSHIITRAGDQTTDFGTGTKYALFIHDGAGWIRQCQGTDAAVETADHTIDYGALLTYGDSPLSFYGATYGDTDVVPPVSAGTSGRQLLIKQDIPDDGILPDLMTSRNLIDCTATTGNQLQMDFRHAFCRLNLYVMKQDEEDDEIRQMEDLKLLKVDIAGTRSSGTFDITGGKWVYSESDLSEKRTYYTNDAGLAVSVSPESIAPAPEKEGASYIFPNTDGEEVSHFNAHECRALAGFDVLEINDNLYGSVQFESIAFSEIACQFVCHKIASGVYNSILLSIVRVNLSSYRRPLFRKRRYLLS